MPPDAFVFAAFTPPEAVFSPLRYFDSRRRYFISLRRWPDYFRIALIVIYFRHFDTTLAIDVFIILRHDFHCFQR
jgi:hypothetical protein